MASLEWFEYLIVGVVLLVGVPLAWILYVDTGGEVLSSVVERPP
jgi:hypothetical protein